MIKHMMKAAIRDHRVIGKDQMKQCACIAQIIKNDSMRKGGFSPSPWVVAMAPRRPGSLAEEDEWGQLGVLAKAESSRKLDEQKKKLQKELRDETDCHLSPKKRRRVSKSPCSISCKR